MPRNACAAAPRAPSHHAASTADALDLLPVQLRDKSSLSADEICDFILRVQVAALYKQIAKGQFPPPLKIGARSVWLARDVVAFLETRKAEALAKQRHRVEQRAALAEGGQ
ncbi:MAG: helix-turn-helix transcriptional regulator [Hyphomicrobiaceae bacterium]